MRLTNKQIEAVLDRLETALQPIINTKNKEKEEKYIPSEHVLKLESFKTQWDILNESIKKLEDEQKEYMQNLFEKGIVEEQDYRWNYNIENSPETVRKQEIDLLEFDRRYYEQELIIQALSKEFNIDGFVMEMIKKC